MKSGVGAVSVFDSARVCSELAPRELAVVCLNEAVGRFVDSCIIPMKPSEAEVVIADAVQEVQFESV